MTSGQLEESKREVARRVGMEVIKTLDEESSERIRNKGRFSCALLDMR
jgi:hypothetical protein